MQELESIANKLVGSHAYKNYILASSYTLDYLLSYRKLKTNFASQVVSSLFSKPLRHKMYFGISEAGAIKKKQEN